MAPIDGPPWESEVHLGAEGALGLIAKTFPKLAKARVEPLGEGWDNTAFLVNDDLVFRFPRRQLGADSLANEIRVLPRLPELTLPISTPTHVGEPIDGFPWPFAGYPYLPGQPVSLAATPRDQLPVLAGEIGRFLRSLHSIGADEAIEFGATPDEIGRLDSSGRLERAVRRVGRLADAGLVEDVAPLRETMHDLAARASTPRATSVCHGDFGPRHVLVTHSGEPTGVVDWGDIHLGDPAVDLGVAWCFPEPAREAFFSAYGPVDEDRRRLARFRAIDQAASLAFWANEAGRPEILPDTLGTLANAAEG